jgi:hypothetical protein
MRKLSMLILVSFPVPTRGVQPVEKGSIKTQQERGMVSFCYLVLYLSRKRKAASPIEYFFPSLLLFSMLE